MIYHLMKNLFLTLIASQVQLEELINVLIIQFHCHLKHFRIEGLCIMVFVNNLSTTNTTIINLLMETFHIQYLMVTTALDLL